MAAISVSSSSAASDEQALAKKLIEEKELLARNYNPIINHNLLPMLQLKQYGDCTLVDPRACLHHYKSAAGP
jgi:hypothetical protein